MNRRRILSLALSIALCVDALAALLFLLGDPVRAQAGTRYVATIGTDSGNCNDPNNPCRTVQYAVAVAWPEDLIKVAAGHYTDVHSYPALSGEHPDASGTITQVVYITKSVTIQGGYTTPGFPDPPDPEANPTTLDAGGQGGVLYITGNISPTLEGLRITGVEAGQEFGGGGIQNDGTLTLTYCTVSGNTGGGEGGGVQNLFILTLNNSTVSGNSSGGTEGSDFFDFGGILTLNNSAVSGGTGDGITNVAGIVTLNDSSVSASASDGIENWDGTVFVNNSTVSGNTSDGIENLDGTLTLNNSTVSDNKGVGINGSGGTVDLQNTIVAGNGAGQGITSFRTLPVAISWRPLVIWLA